MGYVSEEEKTMASLCHGLGALMNLLSMGTMAWLPALIIWLLKKDNSSYLDFQAKQTLAYWIAVPLAIWALTLIGIITLVGWVVTFPAALLLGFCASLYGFLGAIQCYNGKHFEYKGISDLVK
ncbi:MAG: DUF4870 domain-containing protein [Armatimonadetes bacterium]|nr:DUF4870 domain-containing protein [Armatimonadota bacterium]